MNGAVIGDWIGALAATLACGAALAMAFSPTRVATALAFAATIAFAGVAAMATGVFDAGFALLAGGTLATLLALAAGAGIGEIALIAQRPALARIAVCVACFAALLLAWPNTPPLPALALPDRAPVFDLPRGLDLFIALAAFAAAAAGIVGAVGFGARGLFGDGAGAGSDAP